MRNEIIALAADHGGWSLKEAIKQHLEEQNIPYVDFGTTSTEAVNYPEYAKPVCQAIQQGQARLGILCCGTGIGMSLVANKHRGIRAACCSEPYTARMTRRHNDANVLCLGGRVVGNGVAMEIVDAFLETEFEAGGRHEARVREIAEIEEEQAKR